jgi:hypothetical protein
MTLPDLISVTSRPYSSLLRQVNILGKLIISRQLAFNMQMQTETNWCWAATSTSVSHFYWFLSPWTQCQVANGELGFSDCCDSPVPSACNVPWFLDRALTRTNTFVSMMSGQASFQQVRDEIDAGRPVGARIGWGGGGGHFMVIYGYSLVLGMEYFDIDDPIYGKSHLSVTDFASNYQGSGSWTHTYFTRRFFRLPIKELIPIEPILKLIWEQRPLLRVKQDLSFTGEISAAEQEGQTALGLAQRVYSLGLDSLLEGSHALQPVGLRVYEMSGETPQAFFDVTEEEQPRLMQMSASKNHLEPFTRALTQALRRAERSDQEAELRLFRAPALNFEALWLHYEDQGMDTLVPLRGVGRLTPYEAVPLERAFDALRAEARPLAQMDDTMGA